MKKLLFLYFLIIFIIILPYILPIKTKQILLRRSLRNITGKFEVQNIDLNWFSGINIHDLVWQYKNLRLKIPQIKIEGALVAILFGQNRLIYISDGELFYKEQLLLSDIDTFLPFIHENNVIKLQKKTTLEMNINEKGVEKFTNHFLIPSFSIKSQKILIEKGIMKVKHPGLMMLSGTCKENTLLCKKNHLITVILSLLRQKIPYLLKIKFEDIKFNINEGIISYEKTPFLIDERFKILSKGNINLLDNKLNIDIFLTTESLKKAFNLSYLPEGYMVPIKIQGSIDKPRLMTKEAFATIVQLLFLEKIKKNNRVYPKFESF